jgi:hypothetical protein
MKSKSRKSTAMKPAGFFLILAALIFSVPATGMDAVAGDLYIYPKDGQSDEQQKKDRYECHMWAVQQTGYDPTAYQQAGQQGSDTGGEAVRGAAGGAALGAIGGAIGGNAGKGAAMGTAMGAGAGLLRKGGKQRQAEEKRQQQAAQLQAQQREYNRALSTCLEARGYTVN